MRATAPAAVSLVAAPAALLAALLTIPGSVSAQMPDVLATPHDFTAASSHDGASAVSYSEACGSCHVMPGAPAPASGGKQVRYAMYESPTMDMRQAGQPGAASMACLSCHDGTLGSDVHAEGDLGWDLGDDHPISVSYDTTVDPAFRSADEVAGAGLKLYANGQERTVECGSCHNPHNAGAQGGKAFLRVSNENSRLCLICHTK